MDLDSDKEAKLKERLLTLTRSSAIAARERFQQAVRPIYGSTASGRPTHIGSAVLLDANGRKLIVTAAHVIDESAHTSLYIGGAHTLIPIEADFYATRAANGNRRADHYDFAFTEIDPVFVEQLGPLQFISESECIQAGMNPEKCLFTVIGYPNSRNKRVNQVTKKVSGELVQYSALHREQSDLMKQFGLSGDDHLCIDFKKYSFDEEGKKVRSLAPRGMSGGAVLLAANFSDPDIVFERQDPVPKLAGLTTERPNNSHTLIVTRIDVILGAIRSMAQTKVGQPL